MKISSVYITKNEENNIEKSIQGLKAISDEIIVVDTGSTDNTVAICEKLGCKIYHYKWENDFSKARNYAISLCSNDIIIFLDADEYFISPLREEHKLLIADYFKQDIDALGLYETDIEKSTGEQHHSQYAYKIFKNTLKYEGSIHEYLRKDNKQFKAYLTDEMPLIHTGYSDDVSLSKVERNLELLYLIEKKQAMDYFYLGRENLSIGNYEEADRNFDLFFNSPESKTCIKKNNLAYLSYIYKYKAMQQLPHKYSIADMEQYLLRAKAKISHIPEIYFVLGQFYFNCNLKLSLQYFQECILKNETFNSKHFELNNFIGYQHQIYYYMSKILMLMGKKNEAIQKAIVACMLNRHDKNNLGLLLHLLNRQKHTENVELLNRIYKPNSKKDYEFLVQGLENTNLYTEFLTYSLKYNQEYHGGSDSLYYAMMLNGDYKMALESLSNFDNNKSYLIMSVILLFANNLDLFEEYGDKLPHDYFVALTSLISQKFDTDVNFDIVFKILYKLINYGVNNICYTIWQYVFTQASNEQAQMLLSIYNNNQLYHYSIELGNYALHNLQLHSDTIAKEYLYALYQTQDYSKFINEYKIILPRLKDKSISKHLLLNVRNKLITKLDIQNKNYILKEIKNAES